MVALVWPAGFCLSIFSTGIKRFWQFGLIPLFEPLVNQMKFPCDCKLQDILPVNTTLSKTSSQDVGLLPNQLMLEVSGLDAGKFRIVQLPSILICEGEQQDSCPAAAHPHMNYSAIRHVRPRSTHQAIRRYRDRGSPRYGLDSG